MTSLLACPACSEEIEKLKAERDDALCVAAGIEEQAKKNSDYDEWRISKLQAEVSRLQKYVDQIEHIDYWADRGKAAEAEVKRLRALLDGKGEVRD